GTFLGFSSQVLGVELGNGGHDAVQQFARGCLIDVLGGGYELCPSLADGHRDLDVVLAGTSQPVGLVDDDVVDVLPFAQACEDVLQPGAVGTLGALSLVDVLVNHGGPKLMGGTVTGLALSW